MFARFKCQTFNAEIEFENTPVHHNLLDHQNIHAY